MFNKLPFNTYKKSEAKFIKKIKDTYGKNARIYIGDWDAGGHTLKGQTPSKGVGFRKMFRQYGLQVYLVNEFKTSKMVSWRT